MSTLAEKAEILRTQLGLERGLAIKDTIDHAEVQLGLSKSLEGATLMAKADACMAAMMPTVGLQPTVVTGMPLQATAVPMGQVMDRESSHFEALKNRGGVEQTWYIEKHDGSRFIQHNHADGSYQAYRLGTSNVIDSGRWVMENGRYREMTSFPVSGTLHGTSHSFYMDVDCGPHGYHKYIGTTLVYHGGIRQYSAAEAQELNEFAGRISARELAGCWVGLVLGVFPWIGSVEPTDDDSYTRGVQCCFLLPLCGRQYRRTPGTNTFHWHENGVHKGDEDWETFSSNRCACMAPGSPPQGAACGVRIC